ncbi:MAG: PDDEXK nuclease domain-containing protein [Muribaculaceae bacterium]|nr:PDDEXK nuclease domain-containing protein [Muribaculaceae bacterium]
MRIKPILDKDYKKWISQLSNHYRSAQIKAAVAINTEMLRFYWELGRGIVEMQTENHYGSRFFETLSRDLKNAIPEAKGLSTRNLRYVERFYKMYSSILHQFGAESAFRTLHQDGAESKSSNMRHLVADLCRVPWRHHIVLIDKFFDEPETALFYIRETIEHGWSRAVLEQMLDSRLHLRQGKAISNFKSQLPSLTSDLAQEITKDPYIFDFANLTEPYKERELKEALLKNITKFLLELGEGFAFVGQEYKLNVGQTEQFTDLLFYNLKLRCYVVIELKVVKFEPGFLGQLGMYVTAVNHLLKTDHDNPTIGLLVCKTKDDVLAKYSLEGYNLPIGVSQYQLEKLLPDNFKSTLPSIDEIEAELRNN